MLDFVKLVGAGFLAENMFKQTASTASASVFRCSAIEGGTTTVAARNRRWRGFLGGIIMSIMEELGFSFAIGVAVVAGLRFVFLMCEWAFT
jgi:hypothetical protein